MLSKQEDKTNYSFIINCLGALAAAAVIAAAVIVAFALKASTAAAAGLTAKTMLAASASLASIFPAIIPIVGIILLVSAVCLLPFLFRRSNVYAVSSPSYIGGFGSYSGGYPGIYQPGFFQSYPSSTATHVHTSPPVHGHDSGGGYHNHESSFPSNNVHGHR